MRYIGNHQKIAKSIIPLFVFALLAACAGPATLVSSTSTPEIAKTDTAKIRTPIPLPATPMPSFTPKGKYNDFFYNWSSGQVITPMP